MKKFRRMMALLLAMVMVLSMGITAFADENNPPAEGEPTQQEGEQPTTPATTGSINLTGGKAGHTYTLYQIFTGKVDGDQLVEIQWGADAPSALKTQTLSATLLNSGTLSLKLPFASFPTLLKSRRI